MDESPRRGPAFPRFIGNPEPAPEWKLLYELLKDLSSSIDEAGVLASLAMASAARTERIARTVLIIVSVTLIGAFATIVAVVANLLH